MIHISTRLSLPPQGLVEGLNHSSPDDCPADSTSLGAGLRTEYGHAEVLFAKGRQATVQGRSAAEGLDISSIIKHMQSTYKTH